jgi:mRNA-degrading endonuclease RelE of RelBE toxin-antitoxin system
MAAMTFSRGAAKALIAMDRGTAHVVRARLERVASDLFGGQGMARPLRSRDDIFRTEVGEWRAVYAVEDGGRDIMVLRLARRGEAE